MSSSKPISVRDNASKRIMRDITDLNRNPIDYISFEPNDDNMFEGHAMITVQEGIYTGISIHIRIIFPADYPMEPPAAYIADDFPFTSRHHEHVHYRGSICCDLTSNFKTFFSKQERSGWSSACSLSSLLMQLGTFFSDPDLSPSRLPSAIEVNQLKLRATEFACPKCSLRAISPSSLSTTVPTVNIPDVDIIVTDLNNCNIGGQVSSDIVPASPSGSSLPLIEEIIPQEIRIANHCLRQLTCDVSKTNLLEDPTMIIGYPMLLERDKFGKLQLKQIVLETMSYEAYIMEIMRRGYDKIDFYEKFLFVSPSGQSYNYWMPIYINEDHFCRSFETIKNCFCIIEFGAARGFVENDFRPEYALKVLLCLLNKTVVSMLNGSLHESTRAIAAYCHLLRLLMAFLTVYPGLQTTIDNSVKKFIQSNDNRLKSKSGDMGEFIIQCCLSKRCTFEQVKPLLLQEYYARQILWMQKAGIRTGRLFTRDLQVAFDACKVSNQLLVFAIEASKTFIFDGVCARLDARHGFAPEPIVTAFQNRIKEIKTKVVNYSFLVKVVGIPVNSPEQMVAFLTQAHRLSIEQGYTRF